MTCKRHFKTAQNSILLIFSFCLINSCGEQKKEKETDLPSIRKTVGPISSRTEHAEVPKYMVDGQQVYDQYCLSCHQATGSGVSRLNPPLKGTEYVLGDKNGLLHILIKGSNVGLDVDGETYSNAMPSFRHLSDEELADVASYIRNSFGNSAAPVTVEEVSNFRKKNEE